MPVFTVFLNSLVMENPSTSSQSGCRGTHMLEVYQHLITVVAWLSSNGLILINIVKLLYVGP